MTVTVHMYLKIFLLLSFAVGGYILARKKSKTEFFVFSIPIVVIYALIEGLRYNRGVDYPHYKKLYIYAQNLDRYWPSDSIEPLFRGVNYVLNTLRVPYPGAFIFYSAVLIVCTLVYLRPHREVVLLGLPLFLMATIVQSENLVRQYFAYGIILLSISPFLEKKWIRYGSLVVLAYLFHKSSVVFVPFFILFAVVQNPFRKLPILLAIYAATWLWKPEYWGDYAGMIQMAQVGGEQYQGYTENADIWFSSDAQKDYVASTFSLARIFLFNVLLLSLGWRLHSKMQSKFLTFNYHLYAVGAITERLTARMEIPARLSLYFSMFWFIVLAYVWKYAYEERRKSIWIYLCATLMLLNVVYNYISPLSKLEAMNALFIWTEKQR